MIINVKGCSNKLGIIISYLVENEEKTGYDFFNAKKITVKSKADMLAAIKKTLISSHKLPEINANDFISTINKIGKKKVFDTSLKTIVKSINYENMQPVMPTLSHIYFNNKPLPQVKAINITNGNMYFMIKMGSSYNLELIKNERIKCVMVINGLVNLYRRIKQGEVAPKSKKHYIPAGSASVRSRTMSSEDVRNIYHSFNVSPPILEERPVTPSRPSAEEIVPPANDDNWCNPIIYTYSEGSTTEAVRRQTEDLAGTDIPTTERQQTTRRLRTEQREALVEPICEENAEVPQPEITDTAEEERPTERQAVANGDIFTVTERPIRIEEIEREGCLIETPPEAIVADEDEEDRPVIRPTRREAEAAAEVVEILAADEDEEDRPIGIDLAEREAEEERRIVAEEERRTNLEIAVSQASAEREAEEERLINTVEPGRVNEADEADETDREEPAVRQAVTVQSVSRQTGEERRTGSEGQNSFVEYLRENRHGLFDNFQRNSTTSTGY